MGCWLLECYAATKNLNEEPLRLKLTAKANISPPAPKIGSA